MTQEEYMLHKKSVRNESELEDIKERYRKSINQENKEFIESFKNRYFKQVTEWNDTRYYRVIGNLRVSFVPDNGHIIFFAPCESYMLTSNGLISVEVATPDCNLSQFTMLKEEIDKQEFVNNKNKILEILKNL